MVEANGSEAPKHEILEKSNDIGSLEVAYQGGEVYAEAKGGFVVSKGPAKLTLEADIKLGLDAKSVASVGVQLIKDLIPGHFEDALLDAALEKIAQL